MGVLNRDEREVQGSPMVGSLRLYHYEPVVHTLGPGRRAGVWVQGCALACPGCLVPDSHDPLGGEGIDPTTLARQIAETPGLEGLTLSGGEPFAQPNAVWALVTALKSRAPALSVMIFTGLRRELLVREPRLRAILEHADILVDGAYRQESRIGDPWRGSANQRIHYLTNRYGPADHAAAPRGALEFQVRRNGAFFMAGIPEPGVWDALAGRLGIGLPTGRTEHSEDAANAGARGPGQRNSERGNI